MSAVGSDGSSAVFCAGAACRFVPGLVVGRCQEPFFLPLDVGDVLGDHAVGIALGAFLAAIEPGGFVTEPLDEIQ